MRKRAGHITEVQNCLFFTAKRDKKRHVIFRHEA